MSNSHSYRVQFAKYDSSLGANDPQITIVGTVDGFQYVFAGFWTLIAAANLAGGSSAVQSVLAPIMLNTIIISRLVPTILDQLTCPQVLFHSLS